MDVIEKLLPPDMPFPTPALFTAFDNALEVSAEDQNPIYNALTMYLKHCCRGGTLDVMIDSMMKKLLTDDCANSINWIGTSNGRYNKIAFKDTKTATVVLGLISTKLPKVTAQMASNALRQWIAKAHDRVYQRQKAKKPAQLQLGPGSL